MTARRFPYVPGDPNLVSLAEAARLLGVSESTARRLAVAGELPGAIKVARYWRVSLPRMRRELHGEDAPPGPESPPQR